MTDEDLAKLAEIARLHDEALLHALEEDSHHKSQEGAIEISFHNYFEAPEGDRLAIEGVGIYSYVLGPERMHYFDSIDECLVAVRAWHRTEMAA